MTSEKVKDQRRKGYNIPQLLQSFLLRRWSVIIHVAEPHILKKKICMDLHLFSAFKLVSLTTFGYTK